MMFVMKFILTLSIFFLSSQSFAYTADYVPVFKQAKKSSLTELSSNTKKDISKLRSIMNLQNKEMIGLMETDENSESKRSPADI